MEGVVGRGVEAGMRVFISWGIGGGKGNGMVKGRARYQKQYDSPSSHAPTTWASPPDSHSHSLRSQSLRAQVM